VAFNLNEIIPWGRSFDEYRRMFALSQEDLAGRILGCGDGPASFNAEATAKGHVVVSCDPIYAFSAAEIEQRVNACYDEVIAQVRTNLDDYVWGYFHDPDHLGQCRSSTMLRFLADFDQGKADGRYVTASLPSLPFKDGQFDIALVSHLLFLYSQQLDFDFHLSAIKELLRVAKEVRIFPLLTLDRKLSPNVEPVCSIWAKEEFTVHIQAVEYEFQRGSNKMLCIMRNQRPQP
jgi:hypothetical protein